MGTLLHAVWLGIVVLSTSGALLLSISQQRQAAGVQPWLPQRPPGGGGGGGDGGGSGSVVQRSDRQQHAGDEPVSWLPQGMQLYLHEMSPDGVPFSIVSHANSAPYADGDLSQQRVLQMVQLKQKCAADRSTLVVDVGGYLGEFGLSAAALGCRVVVFEVQPLMYKLIRASVRINNFGDRVTVLQRAADKVSGEQRTFMAAGGQTMPGAAASVNGSAPTSFSVATVRLDDVFADNERIEFLKVDVEGFEINALQGAQRLFEGRRVANVVFEYTAFWDGRADQHALLPWLQALGPRGVYALHRIKPEVYGPLVAADFDAFYQDHKTRELQTDVFATFSDTDAVLVQPTGPWAPGDLVRRRRRRR